MHLQVSSETRFDSGAKFDAALTFDGVDSGTLTLLPDTASFGVVTQYTMRFWSDDLAGGSLMANYGTDNRDVDGFAVDGTTKKVNVKNAAQSLAVILFLGHTFDLGESRQSRTYP